MSMAAGDRCHYDFSYLSHAFHLTSTRSSKANTVLKLIQRGNTNHPPKYLQYLVITVIIHRAYENKNIIANSSGILESRFLHGFGNNS